MLSVKVDLENSLEESTQEFTTKDGVFLQFKKNLSECFRLAFTAPPCSGILFDDIGFLGDTEAVQQTLEGTYVFLAGTDPARYKTHVEGDHNHIFQAVTRRGGNLHYGG